MTLSQMERPRHTPRTEGRSVHVRAESLTGCDDLLCFRNGPAGYEFAHWFTATEPRLHKLRHDDVGMLATCRRAAPGERPQSIEGRVPVRAIASGVGHLGLEFLLQAVHCGIRVRPGIHQPIPIEGLP